MAVAGCSLLRENPYSGFSVGNVDFSSPQKEAAILVGDAQAFTRESLINDRLRELRHLEKMLDESDSVSFQPQVVRDLAVTRAFAAQLGVATNPAAGAAFQRNEQIESLKADIETLKLRNELLQLARLAIDEPTSSKLSPTDQAPGVPEGIAEPSTSSIETRLSEGTGRIDTIIKSLSDQGLLGARARTSEIKQSPEERFEDLNAYRARIRQRLNEVALDDAHDSAGNSLYRVQLTATVLPGAVPNKYGVVDFEIVPPEITEDQLRLIYEDWLVSLARRDLVEAGAHGSYQWSRIQTELLRRKLVERVLLSDVPTPGGGTSTMTLFTYPGQDDDTLLRMLDTDRYPVVDNLLDKLERMRGKAMSVAIGPGADTCALTVAGRGGGAGADAAPIDISEEYAFARSVSVARRSLSAIEVFLSSYQSSIAESQQSGPTLNYLDGLEKHLENVVVAAGDFQELVEQDASPEWKSGLDHCYGIGEAGVPEAFRSALSRSPAGGEPKPQKSEIGGCNFLSALFGRCSGDVTKQVVPAVEDAVASLALRGRVRTYQVQPTARTQRLSTLSSAVNSMQAAFSLAATLPAQGVGLTAGASAARTAVGMAEAVEQSPIIVGYADRHAAWTVGTENTEAQREATAPRFGYVLGPKAIINPEKNRLEYRHLPGDHFLFADLSIPSWWPWVTLKVRSAWVGNWYRGSAVLKRLDPQRSIRVDLPRANVSSEGLTEFLIDAPMLRGFAKAVVEEIKPDKVSSCGGVLRFVITGQNLWRNPSVYLRGKRHDELSVLPDMQGIALVFKTKDLPPRPVATVDDRLEVWTSLGKAFRGEESSFKVQILDSVNGRPCPGKKRASEEALRPEQTRFIAGADRALRINFVGRLPAEARGVKLAAQLFPKGVGPGPVVDGSAPSLDPGEFYEGKITVNKPAGLTDDAVNGASLRVGLSYKRDDFGARTYHWAEPSLVFYADESASNFRVKKRTIKAFTDVIDLATPARMEAAYPGFKPTGNALKVEIKGTSNLTIKVVTDWDAQSDQARLKFVEEPQGLGRHSFLNAWCKADQTLKVSVSPGAGKDRPAVEGTVTLAKRAQQECP